MCNSHDICSSDELQTGDECQFSRADEDQLHQHRGEDQDEPANVQNDNDEANEEKSSDSVSDDENDEWLTPTKKRFPRKSAKAKTSTRGVTRVTVGNYRGRSSTLIVKPDAAKKRTKKAITARFFLRQ